jgi:hypothetical protein
MMVFDYVIYLIGLIGWSWLIIVNDVLILNYY